MGNKRTENHKKILTKKALFSVLLYFWHAKIIFNCIPSISVYSRKNAARRETKWHGWEEKEYREEEKEHYQT